MTLKIKPIEKIYKIKKDNGQEFCSRSDKISEGEKIIGVLSFADYLEKNGASVEAINKAREAR